MRFTFPSFESVINEMQFLSGYEINRMRGSRIYATSSILSGS